MGRVTIDAVDHPLADRVVGRQIELGHDQGPAALELAREAGLEARLHADLGGVQRVLEARRP